MRVLKLTLRKYFSAIFSSVSVFQWEASGRSLPVSGQMRLRCRDNKATRPDACGLSYAYVATLFQTGTPQVLNRVLNLAASLPLTPLGFSLTLLSFCAIFSWVSALS
jgi:hypothetical protein